MSVMFTGRVKSVNAEQLRNAMLPILVIPEPQLIVFNDVQL